MCSESDAPIHKRGMGGLWEKREELGMGRGWNREWIKQESNQVYTCWYPQKSFLFLLIGAV